MFGFVFLNLWDRRITKSFRSEQIVSNTYHTNIFVSDENDFDDELDDQSQINADSKSFQDERIKFNCFGECGSKAMKFLFNETNMKKFKEEKYRNQMPRFWNIGFEATQMTVSNKILTLKTST